MNTTSEQPTKTSQLELYTNDTERNLKMDTKLHERVLKAAKNFLKAKEYELLDFDTDFDIVALHNNGLVFIDVKYRNANSDKNVKFPADNTKRKDVESKMINSLMLNTELHNMTDSPASVSYDTLAMVILNEDKSCCAII